jgi:hypothetical protein
LQSIELPDGIRCGIRVMSERGSAVRGVGGDLGGELKRVDRGFGGDLRVSWRKVGC